MGLINRIIGFSTRDVYLVEILTFYERKIIDFNSVKVYFRPKKTFRIVKEKYGSKGTYYKDLIGRGIYKDLYNSNNYAGDTVAVQTLKLDKSKRIKYKEAKILNSIDESNYDELDNIVILKR